MDLEFLAEDFTKLLASLRIGTERIHGIVLALRNFSRLDESEKKLVDIHAGIESTLLILNSKLTSITVLKEFDDCPQIQCFPSQLNQVFMNILSNAADALMEEEAPEIRIRTRMFPDDFVEILISDNGPGMPESVQSKIFEPFFTTKPVGNGTGLGLSISYQIVTERHRGRLNCHSSVGEGTSFSIKIPIA